MPTPNDNKIKYGLEKVYIAKQTEAAGVYTYATPVALPGAVSLSLEAQEESTPFYADNIVYYRTKGNNGYSGSLEVALIPDWFRKEILNEQEDTKGVLVENANNDKQVYFAMLFEFKGDVKATRHVMYNCTVTRPAVSSTTKEASVTPGTDTLNITCDPRSDGLVKAKTGANTDSEEYDGWYTAVYVPTLNAGTGD
jgi:phi13 family phage major tail protein